MTTFILILWITTMSDTTTTDYGMASRKACQTAGRNVEDWYRRNSAGRVVWACITKGEETAL